VVAEYIVIHRHPAYIFLWTCVNAIGFQLGSCSRLTILSLRTNNLANIPDEIGRIPNLHVLNLSDNKLRSLPFGLMKLKNLTALWLADNQVCRCRL